MVIKEASRDKLLHALLNVANGVLEELDSVWDLDHGCPKCRYSDNGVCGLTKKKTSQMRECADVEDLIDYYEF